MKVWRVVGWSLGAMAAGLVGLVGYALATHHGRTHHPDTPRPALSASTDPALIERGRYLVHGPAHCSQCHSSEDRAHPEKVKDTPLHGGLAFAMGPIATTYGRNLTSDRETGIGGRSDADLARTLRTGVMHDGEASFFMRFSAANLADEDIVAVLSYLRSLPPVRREVPRGEWKPLGKVLVAYAFPPITPRPLAGPRWVPPGEAPSVERGDYLANHVALCAFCHSRIDMSTFTPVGPIAGGSDPDPSHGEDADMEFVAPNLTAHPTGITGQLDEDAFVARLRAGRAHASSIMPWEGFAATSEPDLRSIYRYLKSLPPVDRNVGPTYRKAGWKG